MSNNGDLDHDLETVFGKGLVNQHERSYPVSTRVSNDLERLLRESPNVGPRLYSLLQLVEYASEYVGETEHRGVELHAYAPKLLELTRDDEFANDLMLLKNSRTGYVKPGAKWVDEASERVIGKLGDAILEVVGLTVVDFLRAIVVEAPEK